MTNPRATRAIAQLLEQLNETETLYPGTDIHLHYEMITPNTGEENQGSEYFPPDQEL